MTRYGRSPWLDRYPPRRVPTYPTLRTPLTTDVVIVGGGLIGCATAYAFAAARVGVVLLEAGRIGQGATGSGFGWVADTPALNYYDLERATGRRTARQIWQVWRRAALGFAALLRRLDVKCALTSEESLQLARQADGGAVLGREWAARHQAGIEAALQPARQGAALAGTAIAAAIRTRGGSTLDPYRAALGLAAAARASGALLFERSPARRIRAGRDAVEVLVGDQAITASRVIVATGQPNELCSTLRRRVTAQVRYHALTDPVPATIRRVLGVAGVVKRDDGVPPHYIRWVDGDRLLVAGADGPPVAPRARDRQLVQRTGQLMYELSTLYPDMSGLAPSHGWDAAYGRSPDTLPSIGPHRNYRRHLFAFGGSGHAVTDAYLASRILLRHHLGQSDPVDEVFSFART
ncbi:MAG: NAD(P)/FAD-dependent oxidoreductase [Vicinamibacterales bacterium]